MFFARFALSFLLASGAAVAQQYVISTLAGGAPPPTPTPSALASIGRPIAVASDSTGTVYFANDGGWIFRVSANGILSLVGGNGRSGYPTDGTLAINAPLDSSLAFLNIAVDQAGNLYVARRHYSAIQKINSNGLITTIVGNRSYGYSGDGGPATKAQLSSPFGITVDHSGNLFISDTGNNRIRKVTPDGIITTVAGSGSYGYSGDGGLATNAQLASPTYLTMDLAGNLYVADSGNVRVRKISSTGIISTVAGNGNFGFAGDSGPATSAQVEPSGLAVDGSGNLFIAQYSAYGTGGIRRVSPSGVITKLVNANSPTDLAIDGAGNLYLSDFGSYRVRKVTSSGNVTTVAGNGVFSYSGDGANASSAQLSGPTALALDSANNLYIADSGNHRVRMISRAGIIRSVAGTGVSGYSGDGGPATAAQLNAPEGLAFDSDGNLYVADTGNNRIRKISTTGQITTIAGNGNGGFSGDGGPALNAQLNVPEGIALDSLGNLYIADVNNNRIRRIDTGGKITTIAGNGNYGSGGDGGLATSAELHLFGPVTGDSRLYGTYYIIHGGICVDALGNVYVAEYANYQVRKVSTSGIISTVVRTPTGADLLPLNVASDRNGDLYISDGGSSVKRVDSNGIMSVIVGAGQGYLGDGGISTNAALLLPAGIVIESAGGIFVADSGNNAIRLLQPIAPTTSINSVTNGASNLSGNIAPGEVVVIYGSSLGPVQLVQARVGDDGLLPKLLAGTTVSFGGSLAPIIYTSSTQVAAIVPYSVSAGTAQVTIAYQGQTTAAVSVPVASAGPGIFTLDSTGKGPAASVNQDGSINTAATPAKIGDVILLYATGEGQTTPNGVDGKPASVPLPQPNLPVTVSIGGQTVNPQYAGGAPSEVAGVMQINVRIPSGIQAGTAVPVVVQVGNVSSQPGVTIAIR